MPVRLPSPPDPALLSAWSQAACYADKLFDALNSLDEAGGSCKLAASAKWSPAAHARALATLGAARDALDGEIARLSMRTNHYPRRKRLG